MPTWLVVLAGALCIIGGIGWFLLAAFAAGMASRAVTWWESTGRPLLGLAPIIIGIAMIWWGVARA